MLTERAHCSRYFQASMFPCVRCRCPRMFCTFFRLICGSAQERQAKVRAAAQEGGIWPRRGGAFALGELQYLARAAVGGLLRGRTDLWAFECAG